jgi:hypothetical protein
MLYEADQEMVFFDSLDDLVQKASVLSKAPQRARAIGQAGRVKTHRCYSGQAIADFMCRSVSGELVSFPLLRM